jgi:hypothetical protein
MDPEAATVLTSNRQSPNTVMSPTTFRDAKLKHAIESVFVAPWNQYLDQVKKNAIALELKKLSTSHFSEQSTKAAAMLVDEEPAADRKLLMELIKKQTQAENKALKNEVKQLRDSIKTLKDTKKNQKGSKKNQEGKDNAKNVQRGQASGTSKKKEIAAMRPSTKPSRSPSPHRRKNQKGNRTDRNGTDASDNDSREESIGRRRNSGTRKKQQNGMRSKTRRNWQSNASRRESA